MADLREGTTPYHLFLHGCVTVVLLIVLVHSYFFLFPFVFCFIILSGTCMCILTYILTHTAGAWVDTATATRCLQKCPCLLTVSIKAFTGKPRSRDTKTPPPTRPPHTPRPHPPAIPPSPTHPPCCSLQPIPHVE